MNDLLSLTASIIVLIGSLFILISSIGILKMPDLFLRMSATTKAATLGVGLVLIGTSVYFFEIGVAARSFIIILFLFLTAPIAAHMIGRAAYKEGVKLWDKTIVDEIKDKYKQTKTE